ncbi:hypothetical protein TNCV_1366351 [Trichonephila clavipes]|nr:hypothetical protein TNCV_1366351 [Trichonephila clavipes]
MGLFGHKENSGVGCCGIGLSPHTRKHPCLSHPNKITVLSAARHWAVTLVSAHGSNIKQLSFTPIDSQVTSGQQLSMGSAPGRRHAFVPWLTIPEGTQ